MFHDNLLSHSASKSVTAGLGVVEGDEILYRPEARDKRQENFANRVTRDAESKCYTRAWKMRIPPQGTELPASRLRLLCVRVGKVLSVSGTLILGNGAFR